MRVPLSCKRLSSSRIPECATDNFLHEILWDSNLESIEVVDDDIFPEKTHNTLWRELSVANSEKTNLDSIFVRWPARMLHNYKCCFFETLGHKEGTWSSAFASVYLPRILIWLPTLLHRHSNFHLICTCVSYWYSFSDVQQNYVPNNCFVSLSLLLILDPCFYVKNYTNFIRIHFRIFLSENRLVFHAYSCNRKRRSQ
jgi:hypothetical protein